MRRPLEVINIHWGWMPSRLLGGVSPDRVLMPLAWRLEEPLNPILPVTHLIRYDGIEVVRHLEHVYQHLIMMDSRGVGKGSRYMHNRTIFLQSMNMNYECYFTPYLSSYPSPSSSSSNSLKLNGSKAIPSPMKCLLIASTQCSLNECNIALVPSMTHKIAIVRKNQR